MNKLLFSIATASLLLMSSCASLSRKYQCVSNFVNYDEIQRSTGVKIYHSERNLPHYYILGEIPTLSIEGVIQSKNKNNNKKKKELEQNEQYEPTRVVDNNGTIYKYASLSDAVYSAASMAKTVGADAIILGERQTSVNHIYINTIAIKFDR